ncbi:hypothetical protein D9619_010530 [Psilocybe cf. subviscida]|uniref:Uncharacterized protein n=1 Tax=Psilocybe cf. subviscida TaxID=2480587 RepID=A0A8H5ERU5_9AGAR|nr:hypothetical protein D9619_010530 [Psilocybe cf. subviscida]
MVLKSEPTDYSLSRVETLVRRPMGTVVDPFAFQASRRASFLNALLATAIFRCWPILSFLAAWATLITVLNHKGHGLVMQSTLLTVVGTVLGFVISYRTTSSFERYNEGRKLWSQITLASRTFARTVWFHVPHAPPANGQSEAESNARDLYYLVKFLPQYALPRAMGTEQDYHAAAHGADVAEVGDPSSSDQVPLPAESATSTLKRIVTYQDAPYAAHPTGKKRTKSVDSGKTLNGTAGVDAYNTETNKSCDLPLPATTRPKPGKRASLSSMRTFSKSSLQRVKKWTILRREDEHLLHPAQNPPKYGLFDIFPFSLLVGWLVHNGKHVSGKKGAAILREQMHSQTTSHNLPLELSLYLSSYIASLQNRKICDVPTTNTLIAALNQLVDSLTGLERVLTSPIPFSYTVHLWSITIIFCLALPFQIWTTLQWLTIPGTIVIGFIFFGFLVAGEEIENPFGYDKNDLNLDHFTHNIIRNELLAVTSTPPPDPTLWAFVPDNDLLFTTGTDERVSPDEWISRGTNAMQKNLGQAPKPEIETMFRFGTQFPH